MEVIRKFKKSQKGSITIMILTSMLFILVVITASYLAISNESIGQNKKISQISRQYQVTEDEMEQEYQTIFNNMDFTIEQVKSNSMLKKVTNTETEDAYGNKVVIPAGFKVTEDTIKVTEGIVIEDEEGNQFVWVPVGEIYTDLERTEDNKKKITLGRYEFAEDGTPSDYSGSYTEDTPEEHDSNYENAIAKDIEAFKTSVSNNHGYYIGRYEARKGSDGNLTENGTDSLYNYITQSEAATVSRNMYTTETFTSDLMNSYGWNTAIVFLQTFDDRVDKTKPYSRQNSLNKGTATKGTNNLTDTTMQDKICNIWDIASNTQEWTTENSNNVSRPCVTQGGDVSYKGYYTSGRVDWQTLTSGSNISFRPIIYIQD